MKDHSAEHSPGKCFTFLFPMEIVFPATPYSQFLSHLPYGHLVSLHICIDLQRHLVSVSVNSCPDKRNIPLTCHRRGVC